MRKILTKIFELDDRLCSYGVKVTGISPAPVVFILLPLYLLGMALYILTLKLLTYLNVSDGWVAGVAAIGGLAGIFYAIALGSYFILLPFTFIGFHIIPPHSRVRFYTKILVYAGYFALWIFMLHALGFFDYLQEFSFTELADEHGSVLAAIIIVLLSVFFGGPLSALISAITYAAALYWDIMKFMGQESDARPPIMEDVVQISPSEWNSITAVSYIFLVVLCIHAMLLSEDSDDVG